jgi:predicted enzyme related to lactoylglutathione lyase
MAVQVYGSNHIAIEVDDAKKAVAFYSDMFNLKCSAEAKARPGVSWGTSVHGHFQVKSLSRPCETFRPHRAR